MSKVTILIPTYNQGRYLPKAIESALSQSYQDLEVVVVDDGSSDDTPKVVGRFQSHPNFKYFRNTQNLGRVRNYRHGLFDCAIGDYVLNLDGDDWLSDAQYIGIAVAILDQHPEVGFVVAGADTYYEKEGRYEKQRAHQKSGVIDGLEYLNDIFADRTVFAHLAAVYRREDAINANFYSVDSTWTDGISFFRLACRKKVALVSRSVGVWRLHDKNESRIFYQHALPKDVFQIVDLISEECPQLSLEAVNWCRYQNLYHYIAWATKSGKFGKIIDMLQYLVPRYPGFLKKNGFQLFGRLIFGLLLYFPRRAIKILQKSL